MQDGEIVIGDCFCYSHFRYTLRYTLSILLHLSHDPSTTPVVHFRSDQIRNFGSNDLGTNMIIC